MVGRVILHLSFISDFLKLVCYAHVFPCIDLTQIQRMTDANTGSVEELLKAKSNELLKGF